MGPLSKTDGRRLGSLEEVGAAEAGAEALTTLGRTMVGLQVTPGGGALPRGLFVGSNGTPLT